MKLVVCTDCRGVGTDQDGWPCERCGAQGVHDIPAGTRVRRTVGGERTEGAMREAAVGRPSLKNGWTEWDYVQPGDEAVILNRMKDSPEALQDFYYVEVVATGFKSHVWGEEYFETDEDNTLIYEIIEHTKQLLGQPMTVTTTEDKA